MTVQSLWTDGSRLYFNEEVNGNWRIAQVSAQGGERQPLMTSISTPLLLALAPNRSELLVQSLVSNDPLAPMWTERPVPSVGSGIRHRPRRSIDYQCFSNSGQFSTTCKLVLFCSSSSAITRKRLPSEVTA